MGQRVHARMIVVPTACTNAAVVRDSFGVKSAIGKVGQSLPVYNCKQTVSESCALRVRPPADLCVSGAGSPIISLARTSSVGAILTALLLRPDSCQERSRQTATTFPGFMMFSGSMARFSVRINSTAGAPCSVSRYFIFFCPTPCSPVQVPFIAIARATRRSMNS